MRGARREFKCSYCGNEDSMYESKAKQLLKLYCCRECFTKDRSHSSVTFTCDLDGCNVETTVYKSVYENSQKHYCSEKCRDNGKERIWIDAPCSDKTCNNTRRMRLSQFNRKGREGGKIYCSHSCAGKNSGGNTKSRGRTQGCKFVDGYIKKPKEVIEPKTIRREDFKKRWKDIEW